MTPEHPGQGGGDNGGDGSSAAKIATSVFASVIAVLNLWNRMTWKYITNKIKYRYINYIPG